MARLGLEKHVVDQNVYDRTVVRFRERGIRLPTFAELAEPWRIPAEIRAALADVDPDAPNPLNLFRVHWYNAADRRGMVDVPGHIVLPRELTGCKAPIVVLLGERFPMISAHKVLAAYGCLAPRIVTGQFDPTTHKAIWPSTGNYCRGGVAISRIMACHGVAILPEEMSRERFRWLERWVADQDDIVATPGCESNVKEIYDVCNAMDLEPQNIIFNQFSEFANHLAHFECTGRASGHVFEHLAASHPGLTMRAYVSATGSGGTLAAGDYLKDHFGAAIVAVEALECPTLLYNGFGGHNIQGIGDKHVPLIHNVMNTDYAVAVSERSTDGLNVLFGSEAGRRYLVERRGLAPELVDSLRSFGLSSICNILAAIKVAKYLQLGSDEAVFTVATDNASMYATELDKALEQTWPGGFDAVSAGEVYGQHLAGLTVDHLLELSHYDRHRVFNLGYYTWVEQQGIEIEAFNARRQQSFWRDLRPLVGAWDEMIEAFNARVGAA